MASLGFTVPLHRMLAFTFAGFLAAMAGVLAAWWNGQTSPSDLGLVATINLLVMAVIGGLARIEGAWLGAFAFIVINNEVTNRIPADGLWVVGGTFNTVVGLIFLAIVIVSPDGLMGIWDRVWRLPGRRPGPPEVEIEAAAGASPS
jgi:branched-chain amino acid transport system permease protein